MTLVKTSPSLSPHTPSHQEWRRLPEQLRVTKHTHIHTTPMRRSTRSTASAAGAALPTTAAPPAPLLPMPPTRRPDGPPSTSAARPAAATAAALRVLHAGEVPLDE